MNYDMQHTEFTKSLLAGVFAGIGATVICLLFNTFFRGYTGFFLSELINVSTVIFAVLTLGTIAGPVFYCFHHYFKNGTAFFQLASLLITVLLIIGAFQVQRSADVTAAKDFRSLLAAVITITGLCISIGIPFLYRHDYI
ncbi:hypothetical protein [Ferruginibacter profundus]